MALSSLQRIISITILIVALVYGWKYFTDDRRPPCYSIDVKYFGSPSAKSTDEEDLSIKPFTIPFDRSQVDDVINRLNRARFYEPQIIVDHVHVNRSTYGFNRHTAESVREYFINTFDWKKIVQELNQLNHFKTKIAVSDSINSSIRSEFSQFRSF